MTDTTLSPSQEIAAAVQEALTGYVTQQQLSALEATLSHAASTPSANAVSSADIDALKASLKPYGIHI
jgi:hypothetical protein